MPERACDVVFVRIARRQKLGTQEAFLLAAEPVGTMAPEPPGKTQDSAPVLYVEFRKEGRPIDPEPWWFEGSQKVQG